MSTRPVRYELHIRPLLRLIDRDNMSWAFDLWSYQDVRDHADDILQRIQADMPPTAYGGLWPSEWVALFERWIDEGFLRLDLGTVNAQGYKATLENSKVTLTGRGTAPTSGYRTWLDGVIPEGQSREYVHYWETPVPAGSPSPTLFRVKAVFEASPAMTAVKVIDANGTHQVPIQTTPSPILVRQGFDQVRSALEKLGAVHAETLPMAGGSISRFQMDSADVEVFATEHGTDLEGPDDTLVRLKKAFKSPNPP